MREERATARDLPFESGTELFRIDRDQNEIALAGEVLRRGLGRLRTGREMDKAVLHIDAGAAENPGALGFGPFRGRQNLIDELRHDAFRAAASCMTGVKR